MLRYYLSLASKKKINYNYIITSYLTNNLNFFVFYFKSLNKDLIN